MVFPSVSLYQDPPVWQHQNHKVCGGDGSGGGGGTQNPLLPSLPPPHHLGSMGAIRPGSTADRARMARLPPPEALKCPRCDSSNTKFCYYNNYSLLQPRHFCKTCRRYWTHGGALRNVPVGGGCRRNKRSSKRNRSCNTTSSKSPSASNSQPPHLLASDDDTNNNTTTIPVGTTSSAVPEMFSLRQQMEPSDPPFLPALHGFANYGFTDNIGLTVDGGMQHHASPPGGFDGGGEGFLLGSAGGGGPPDQWRVTGKMQHIPFIGGLDYPNAGNFYCLQGNADQLILPCAFEEGQLLGSKMEFGSAMKMEGSPNLPAPFLGVNSDSTDFWYVNNKWAELSGGAGSSSAAAHFFTKTSA